MNEKLNIAIGDFSPLIIKENGKYTGFEIELWEAIAKEAQIQNFEYSQLPFSEIISSVAAKKYDLALSGITINSDREKLVDFSYPTLDSGLMILVNKDTQKLNLWNTIKLFFQEGYSLLLYPFLFVVLFIFVFGNLLWFAERNAHTFSSSYFPAIFESFWFVISTMSTDSFGDYIPHTWLGRIITIFAIVGGVAIFGLFIARITAFLTFKKIKSEISDSHDLANKTVATVKNSTSVAVLEKIGAKIIEVDTLNEAYNVLSHGSANAVVFDAPMLIYFVEKQNSESKRFALVGDLFEKQKYGIALQSGSVLREKLNQAILKLRESGAYDSIYRKWFGEQKMMES